MLVEVDGSRRRRRGSGAPVMSKYTPGGNVVGSGGTFARADATTCATYIDANGVVQTVAANVLRDSHYIGGVRTTLLEGARTNNTIQNRTLGNAAWTASNCTVSTTLGADGAAGAASRLTATAGNATVIVTTALVHGSQARAGSALIKRITGTGNIQFTLDNGATWTTITTTASYAQVFVTQTLANSQFGIRLVTNGDVVDVDYTQNEAGAFCSSPIATTAASVTRAYDQPVLPIAFLPQALTMYTQQTPEGGAAADSIFGIGVQSTNGSLMVYRPTATTVRGYFQTAGGNVSTGSVTDALPGQTAEYRLTMTSAGVLTLGVSINGGAETVSTSSGPLALPAAWHDSNIYLEQPLAQVTPNFAGWQKAIVAAGVQSLAVMRSL